MAEYTRLLTTSSVEDYESDEYKETSVPQVSHDREGSRFDSLLLASLIAMLAIMAAGAFHLSVLTAPSVQRIPSTREVVSGLAIGDLNKNLDAGRAIIRHNSKTLHPTSGKMWFPASMTRVNAEEPDTTYTAGSHVVLSPSDSMIYQWRFNSNWTRL